MCWPQLPSVGGYASIVSGTYNARTLTHVQGQLNIARLGAGELDGLDLQAIVTVPEYFLLPLSGDPTTVRGVRQVTEARGSDPVLPSGIEADLPDSGYPTYPAPRGELATGQASTWFFGESLRPTRARLLLTAAATAGSPAPARAGSDSARCAPTGRRRGGRPSRLPPVPAVPRGRCRPGPRRVWPCRSCPDVCHRIKPRSWWGSGSTSSTAPSPR